MSPERKGPQDALRASRTRSGLVGIHEAYRTLMEALGLFPLEAMEQAAAEPLEFLRTVMLEVLTPEPGPEFLERPVQPESPAKIATLFFLRAWFEYADPETPSGPLPEAESKEAVSLAVEFFFMWRRKVESLSPPGGGISEKAIQLAYMEAAVAMETNLARSPIFSGGKPRGPVQLSLEPVGFLYGRPFNVLEPKGPLTVPDAQLLAHLIKRYAEEGFPPDRRVRMSLSEAARASGYSTPGGRQRELVRRAFMRMRSTTYQNVVRLPDGTVKSLTWGLIDWAATYEPSEETGRALVTLSEPLVALVQAGSLVYLQEDLFAELVRRDEYGARLWVFLESESLSSTRDYYLFSAPEGEPERERDTPAIADLLRIDWTERRTIAHRIKKAAQVISGVDPRYSLSVEKAARRAGKGMWTLHVRKRRGPLGDLEAREGATGYSQERYRVLPVTRPGTPSNADTPFSPVNTEVSEVTPSVLPSVLPSARRRKEEEEEAFGFLKAQLGRIFGSGAEEIRNPESDLALTLERAARKVKKWVRTDFPEATEVTAKELRRRMLREMLVGLEEARPKDPLRYLSAAIHRANTPTQLLIADYAWDSLKRWYRAQTDGD